MKCSKCNKRRPVDGMKTCQRCLDYARDYHAKNREYRLFRQKEIYHENKKNFLCVKCRKEKIVNGHTCCINCIDLILSRNKKYYEKNKEERLKYGKERYEMMKKYGKCACCGIEKTEDETGVFCMACADDNRERVYRR